MRIQTSMSAEFKRCCIETKNGKKCRRSAKFAIDAPKVGSGRVYVCRQHAKPRSQKAVDAMQRKPLRLTKKNAEKFEAKLVRIAEARRMTGLGYGCAPPKVKKGHAGQPVLAFTAGSSQPVLAGAGGSSAGSPFKIGSLAQRQALEAAGSSAAAASEINPYIPPSEIGFGL